MKEVPHKRYNPLLDEWVLVSPHRTKRPWQGQQEKSSPDSSKSYDESCYLCPGNSRAEGSRNPNYQATFVFYNDFAALQQISEPAESSHHLLLSEPQTGVCRVICYSPDHSLSMARFSERQIEQVITTWKNEHTSLAERKDICYVQIFENRGSVMGCSNPHPHGQIWATSSVPNIPAKELLQEKKHLDEHRTCLLCSYLEIELKEEKRIVYQNEDFLALVPYWATWPYELMILPKRHFGSIIELKEREQLNLARALKEVAVVYDNLFQTSFPYSMGFHQAPTDDGDYPEHHFHIHYFPPLLRSATIKKFMVGFEMLAMPQRDLTAEGAAEILNQLPRAHYLEKR